MDINQNQQINTFLKGMNTDTSDMLLSSDQYRFARNVRVITDTENNSGELRLVDGNTPINLSISVKGTILAMDSIRDIIVLIVKEPELVLPETGSDVSDRPRDDNEEQELQQLRPLWSIYTHKNGVTTKILSCTDEKIWSNESGKTIATVLRWESENNIKLYIADGIDTHGLMSVQINKTYDSTTFQELFEYYDINLPNPTIKSEGTGRIPEPVVRYAYRLYSENGGATTMSALSEQISLYSDSSHGFGPEKYTNRSVSITIPDISSGILDKIQIYRIGYKANGYQPTITVIADINFQSGGFTIIDYGYTSVETLSPAEFLSLYNTKISPSVIESKGDYLFLAGDSYFEDLANKKFSNADARCFSRGNYYLIDGQTINALDIENNTVTIHDEDTKYLRHRTFDNNSGRPLWTSDCWSEIDDRHYNGIGKMFAWKYTFAEEHELTPKKQEGCRSYRREEVYRFGVRFFDSHGNASSVKWMCDILMPPMFKRISSQDYDGISVTSEGISVKELGIEFIPLNVDSIYWENIAAYEIVQCKRTLDDSYVITQGIGGRVFESLWIGNDSHNLDAWKPYLQPSGFVSMNSLYGVSNWFGSISTGEAKAHWFFRPSNTVFMFSSPEYVYQKDDIKDIINQHKDTITVEDVIAYRPISNYVDENTFRGNHVRQEDEYQNLKALGLMQDNNNEEYHTVLGVRTAKLDDTVAPSYYIGFNDGPNYQDSFFIDNIVQMYNNTFGVSSIRTTPRDRWDYTNILISMSPRDDSENYYAPIRTCAHYLNYFYPESITINTDGNPRSVQDPEIDIPSEYKIKEVAYADSPDYSDYVKDKEFTLKKNITSINNKSFINWACPLMAAALDGTDYWGNTKWQMSNVDNPNGVPNINDPNYADEPINESQSALVWLYPTGSGGRCMLFAVDNIQDYTISDRQHMPYINVQNVIKYANPYGGYSQQAFEMSTYISVGGYAEKSESIKLFSGDVFIKMFTYNAAHEWYDSEFTNAIKMATIYAVPVETTIDIQAQFSSSLYNVDTQSIYVQDKASSFSGYTQSTDAYLYNTAYNVLSDIRTWYPDLTTKGETNDYDTRIHFSERKINNEKIDNWLQYRSSNFLDVDSRYGKITAMKLFKDRLTFWQEHAFGLLAVNERVLINDVNDVQLQLGTGGVLERFDYVSQIYGMKKNQQAYATSDSALYWWDGNNKEILQYGQGLAPLSTLKQIKNYINSGEESDIPTVMYDDKYKEVICNVVNNESVSYSEQTQAFTSVYDEDVQFWCNILGTIYESKQDVDSKIYLHNSNNGSVEFFGNADIHPFIKYVVNKDSQHVKTFDIQTFGGRFYGGDMEDLNNLSFDYYTPLKQHSSMRGGEDMADNRRMTNLEYDFRLNIPRNGADFDNKKDWGDRMRGKTMQCEIKSDSNNTDFSLQYIITKFRMSWT